MPPIDRYRHPTDLPAHLAVFPLRGCILLPRAVLPLHIFEPRYLAMLEAVISGSRLLGIIQPQPDVERTESPAGSGAALKSVGCAGRVTAFQELDDGRLVISLTGVCRFETVAETTAGTPFRTFGVNYLRFADDLAAARKDSVIDRTGLLKVLAEYLEAHKLSADWRAIEAAPAETLVNALSVMSPFEPEEKQALLEAAGVTERADVLCALARMDIAGGQRDSSGRMQ